MLLIRVTKTWTLTFPAHDKCINGIRLVGCITALYQVFQSKLNFCSKLGRPFIEMSSFCWQKNHPWSSRVANLSHTVLEIHTKTSDSDRVKLIWKITPLSICNIFGSSDSATKGIFFQISLQYQGSHWVQIMYHWSMIWTTLLNKWSIKL